MSGHEVNGLDSAESNDVLVLSAIALYAYRLDGQEYSERLADLVIPACLAELLEEDGVCPAEQIAVLLLDLTKDPYSEAGARERVPEDDLRRKAELESDLSDLVLEELPEGLNEGEIEVLRQAADVVVRLDDMGLAGLEAADSMTSG